jgi:hypothetical protein
LDDELKRKKEVIKLVTLLLTLLEEVNYWQVLLDMGMALDTEAMEAGVDLDTVDTEADTEAGEDTVPVTVDSAAHTPVTVDSVAPTQVVLAGEDTVDLTDPMQVVLAGEDTVPVTVDSADHTPVTAQATVV